ncbi:hypothetical protein MIZ03_1159 [Rhodoferax lithotrophicus]|uniref:Copper resistance protein D domain-containing protein n=1 Tax=Rhodoferax lithotrophicus TaxID=2798804 RepID=A0ABM7MJ35_9BURK|nr:CopD family protein [Rhodoferax sp. MIZ03]BCO26279.1 hypothetical protein MIZ03_1159 [Rhodoferax sp. MIZ03]
MLYALLKTLHLLSIVVWIGGMVFAHFFLRPAVGMLEPALRVRLMHAVLGRFFNAVLVVALLTLVTGSWMIVNTAAQLAQSEARFRMPLEWMIMATLGMVMMLIFGHIRFVLYKRLGRALQDAAWPKGAAALAQIRLWVMVNLVLGVVIVLVTVLGVSR